MQRPDPQRSFEYEHGYFLTAPVGRISKFVTHLDLYRRILDRPGEVVECGVFRGNSLMRFIKFRALLENTTSRRIVGFDTFGDFPEAGLDADRAQRDAFVAETGGGQSLSLEDLKVVLREADLDGNVELVKGDIAKTAADYVAQRPQTRVALLHVDVDLYEPTLAALEAFYPHVVRGGVVILDDYGAFPGANRAIEEYFGARGPEIRKLPYSHAIAYLTKD